MNKQANDNKKRLFYPRFLSCCHSFLLVHLIYLMKCEKKLEQFSIIRIFHCLYISLRLFFFIYYAILFKQKFLNKYLMLISHSLFIIFYFDCHYNRFLILSHFALFLWTLNLNNFEEVIDLNRIQKSRTNKLLLSLRDIQFTIL